MILVSNPPSMPFALFSRRASPPAAARRQPTHRFVLRLNQNAHEVVPVATSCLMVRCITGSLWLTHDGDPKDVILGTGDGYAAQRPERMVLHALSDCTLEMQFSPSCG